MIKFILVVGRGGIRVKIPQDRKGYSINLSAVSWGRGLSREYARGDQIAHENFDLAQVGLLFQ